MRRALFVFVAAVALSGPGCRGEVSPDRPDSVTKDGWEEWAGAPVWVVAPPPHEGFAPFVIAGQSNLLHLTLDESGGYQAGEARRLAARRLRPVLGEDADAAVAKAAAPALVRKGYYLQHPKRGQDYPGAQTYTAYQLWELPLAALLAGVPESKREAASRAVRAPEPEGAPAWELGKAPPAWARAPSAREGHATVLIRQSADRVDVARVNATAIGPGWMEDRIASALSGLADRNTAFGVGRAAEGWAVLRARAVEIGDGDPVAWTLWDAPLAPILAAVGVDKRAAVAKALEAPLRPE